MKKKLLLLLAFLGLAATRVTVVKEDPDRNEWENRLADAKLNVERLARQVRLHKEIVDICFEAYGSYAASEYDILQKWLTEIWKKLGQLDKERMIERATVRLDLKEKKETWEGTFK